MVAGVIFVLAVPVLLQTRVRAQLIQRVAPSAAMAVSRLYRHSGALAFVAFCGWQARVRADLPYGLSEYDPASTDCHHRHAVEVGQLLAIPSLSAHAVARRTLGHERTIVRGNSGHGAESVPAGLDAHWSWRSSYMTLMALAGHCTCCLFGLQPGVGAAGWRATMSEQLRWPMGSVWGAWRLARLSHCWLGLHHTLGLGATLTAMCIFAALTVPSAAHL